MAAPRSFRPKPPPKPVKPPLRVSRRQLLVGGGAGVGLIVAWGLWPRRYRPNVAAAPGETVMNAWLKIGEDGHVTAVVPQAEMGQGVWTSLAQILADELGADWRTMGVEPAPPGPLYANTLLFEEAAGDKVWSLFARPARWLSREGAERSGFVMTAGSTSIRMFEQPLREAAATARAMLQMAAAETWKVDWQALDTAAGFVTHGDEKMRFAGLAAKAATFTPPADPPLREVGEGDISGHAVPRLDLPSKIDGTAQYAADVRLPGMLFASVRNAPHPNSRFERFASEKAAEQVPGVVKLFRNPGWIAVVASNWWAADQALDRMQPRFTLEGLPSDKAVASALDAALTGTAKHVMASEGDADGALAVPQGRVEATYSVPFGVHAPIEPLTATARVTGDRLEVWAPTQAPGIARAAAARAAGFAEAQVTIYPMFVGGGFGRKIEVDAIEQAAIIAAQLKKPVQLTWNRAEETMRDRFRPPARARMAAVIGPGKRLAAWKARIAAPATMRALEERLMPGFSIGGGASAEPAAVAGAAPPYAIPAMAVEHATADVPIGTGMGRAVAHSYTAFFTEGFMDELALLAGVDPVSFRIQHLGGAPRLARCLQRVAQMGEWDGPGKGQGVACHSAFGSHVAMLAEAEVADDRIRVRRVIAVVDCGRTIHPDIVAQNIESGIVWGLAATMQPPVGFASGMATIRDFMGLNLPTLKDTPEIIVEVIESQEAPGGVGEVGVPPVAPAIANALFAATGARLRDLPLALPEA